MRKLAVAYLGAVIIAATVAAQAGEADFEEVSRIVDETRAYRATKERAPRRGAWGFDSRGRRNDKPPEQPTAEPAVVEAPDLVAYLEESLGEGLGTGDHKLVDLTLSGLVATGKDTRELMASVNRAALDSALSYPNVNERVKIDAWTLAVKARLGDDSATDILWDWVTEPDQPPNTVNRRDRKAMTRSRIKPIRCAEALPCLAYLKVDGVRELAEEILRNDGAAGAGEAKRVRMPSAYGGQKMKSAMQILLSLDREEGTRLVLSLIEGPQFSIDHRAQLFGAGAELLGNDDAAKERLANTFRNLADAMIARGFDGRRVDTGMMTLLNATSRSLPKQQAVLEGLERLEAALPARMKRYVTSRLSMYRRQMGITDKPTSKPKPGAWPARPTAPRPAPRAPVPPVEKGGEGTF